VTLLLIISLLKMHTWINN